MYGMPLHYSQPTLLRNSHLGHMLQKQVDLYNKYKAMQGNALKKVEQNQKNFIKRQKSYYSREKQQKIDKSAEKMQPIHHRNKITRRFKKLERESTLEAERHLASRMDKIDKAASKREQSSRCSSQPHSPNHSVSHSTHKEMVEKAEISKSVSIFAELAKRQKRTQSILAQKSKINVQKSKALSERMSSARSRFVMLSERQEQENIYKCIKALRVSEQKKLEVLMLERKLIKKEKRLPSRTNTEQPHHHQQKMMQAQLYRGQLKKLLQARVLMIRSHDQNVFLKAQKMREKQQKKLEVEVRKKQDRFRQIEMYKRDCEKLRQGKMFDRFTAHIR